MVRNIVALAATLTLLLHIGVSDALASKVDWSGYDTLLQKVVKDDGLVDYAQVKTEIGVLETLLKQIAQEGSLNDMPNEEGIAFGVNAYNAVVLHEVAKRYPIDSVKDVDGFFDKPVAVFFGEKLSLNDWETKLKNRYRDPRTHLILNCAAMDCPKLRNRAYTGENLEKEIQEQGELFARDPRHVFIRTSPPLLKVNKIFTWYKLEYIEALGSDKAKYPNLKVKEASIVNFLRPFAPSRFTDELISNSELKLEYMEYDWALNAAK